MNLNARLLLDNSGFIKPAQEALNPIRRLTQELGGLGRGAGGSPGAFAGMANTIAEVRNVAIGAFTPIAALYGLFRGVGGAIKAASQMEDFQTSFSTLLGGIDAAQQRMEELAQFAQTTPFDLPQVVQASRVLETLTQGALSTGDGLRTVGDVAANTGQSFAELAMWIGRTYDGLQSGRPIGEALMRLQEMGVVSGETRAKIEALQAEGKRGAEVWGVAAQAFGRFSGEMERRSATLSGRTSNFRDSIAGLARELGGPLAAMANDPLRRTSTLLDDIAGKLRDVKLFWLEAFGVVPEGKFPGPASGPKAPPAARGSPQNVKTALVDFFGPLDQLSRAKGTIQEVMSTFADLRAQRTLHDPFASSADRERAIGGQARRAFRESGLKGDQVAPGVTADPQDVDDALRRVDAEMKLLEAMKDQDAFAGHTAEKMERLVAAYEKLVGLSNQLQGIRKSAVDSAITDFFGSMDKPKESRGSVPTDPLARVGIFVGAGGPANDHARRTANGVEALVRIAERINATDRGIRDRNAAIDRGLADRSALWD